MVFWQDRSPRMISGQLEPSAQTPPTPVTGRASLAHYTGSAEFECSATNSTLKSSDRNAYTSVPKAISTNTN